MWPQSLNVAIKTESGYSKKKGNEKLLEEIRSRFKHAHESWEEPRRQALDDLKFRAGEQWPEKLKAQRATDGRPCLVVNRIPQFLRQITNDQRQNRPAIKVHPVDDGGDNETADVIQGIIRHIENNSNAEAAYDTAFESAACGGFGYFRIATDYCDEKSFDQDILIKRVHNPFAVFFDPSSVEPDGSDANFAFIVEDMPKDEYKAAYPGSDLTVDGMWDVEGNSAPDWVTENGARVAEYFYKKFEKKQIALLSDGTVVDADQLPEDFPEENVIDKREAEIVRVKWCKTNGVEILEQNEWMGKYIPIIPVFGDDLHIEGKRILEGVIRQAKDPQRMLNFWKSAETEAIALAPRAPFIAAEGQLEGYEQDWKSANSRNHAVLQYKPTTLGGQMAPPPQRQAFEPAVQAITMASREAADDLKETTGIFDAARGARSNETSGVAIQRRQMQAQTSNFHFVDNLTRSLRFAGRILVDLIPRIYDNARAVRILGEDGTQRVVRVNEQYVDQDTEKDTLYDLSAGKYDVTVSVGPSFASKREEAAASMLELSKANPQIWAIAGDLMARNMDWPGSDEIADRLKKMLPPQLQGDGKESQMSPQIQAQMQQAQQMVEALTNELNDAQDKLDNKRLELESKERIEMRKLETDVEIQMAKLDSVNSVEILRAEIGELSHRQKLLNFNQPIPDGSDVGGETPAMANGPMETQTPTGGAAPGLPME